MRNVRNRKWFKKLKVGDKTYRTDKRGLIWEFHIISDGCYTSRCLTPTREKLPQVIHIDPNPPFKTRGTLKEASEEWEKQHPEQALKNKMDSYDFSDKYPEMNCPACDKKMTWAKTGRFAFCFNCYSFVSFSDEGLEIIYKKQGK